MALKSDLYLISGYNIAPESNVKVTGMTEMITSSLSCSTLGNVNRTGWGLCLLMLGCKGSEGNDDRKLNVITSMDIIIPAIWGMMRGDYLFCFF